MARAVSAVLGLGAVQTDPGIVWAIGKVLMGSESHCGNSHLRKCRRHFFLCPRFSVNPWKKVFVLLLHFDFGSGSVVCVSVLKLSIGEGVCAWDLKLFHPDY